MLATYLKHGIYLSRSSTKQNSGSRDDVSSDSDSDSESDMDTDDVMTQTANNQAAPVTAAAATVEKHTDSDETGNTELTPDVTTRPFYNDLCKTTFSWMFTKS